MGCTVCGGSPCSCQSQQRFGAPLGLPRSCVDEINSSDCCMPAPACPLPAYAQAPAAAQPHAKSIYIQQFASVVKIADSWNVPNCDAAATVTAPNLTAIIVGGYLWNATYGYFEIQAFNSANGQLQLVNHCNDGNAVAGSSVPSCTEFIVTVPPDVDADSGQVCVAIDFTAPAVNSPLDITLTATTGVAPGGTVQIGTGFYQVNAVKPNDIIAIENVGDGITPGTPVIAVSPSGAFNYCLQVIAANPCAATPIPAGRVIGCSGAGLLAPVEGQTNGYVLTCVDSSNNLWEARPLGPPVYCTTVATAVSIVSGNSTYTVAVDDSSGFSADPSTGDLVEFGGFVGLGAARVNTKPDAGHINITFLAAPLVTETIPVSTTVCQIGCCEQNSNDIVILQTDLSAQVAGSNGAPPVSLTFTPSTVDSGAAVSTSDEVSFSVTNTSTDRTLKIVANIVLTLFGTAIGATTDQLSVTVNLKTTTNANPYPGSPFAANGGTWHLKSDAATPNVNITLPATINLADVAPGVTTTYKFKAEVGWIGAGSSAYGFFAHMDLSYVGVMV